MNNVIIVTQYETVRTGSVKAALEFLATGEEFYFESGSDAAMAEAIAAALPAAVAACAANQAALKAAGAVTVAAQKAAMSNLVARINAAIATLKNASVAEVSEAYKKFASENEAIRGVADFSADKALESLLALTKVIKADELEAKILAALKEVSATYEQVAEKLSIDEFKVQLKMAGMVKRGVLVCNKRGVFSLK